MQKMRRLLVFSMSGMERSGPSLALKHGKLKANNQWFERKRCARHAC